VEKWDNSIRWRDQTTRNGRHRVSAEVNGPAFPTAIEGPVACFIVRDKDGRRSPTSIRRWKAACIAAEC
jgi:hypothetical protein